MPEQMADWLDWLDQQPHLQTLLASAALIFAAWLSNWIVKRILVRGLYRLLRHAGTAQVNDFGIIKRLSNIVPALVLSIGVSACRACRTRPSRWCATSAAASSC